MTDDQIKKTCKACPFYHKCLLTDCDGDFRMIYCDRLQEAKVSQEMEESVKSILAEFDNPKDHCSTCPDRNNCAFQRLRDNGKQASCPYHNNAGQKFLKQYSLPKRKILIDPTLLETRQPYQLN